MHFLTVVAVLFCFWLLLSGHYIPFLLMSGIAASFAVAAFAWRMGALDREGQPLQLARRALRYWPWLVWEIVKAAWDVSKLILHPKLPISPTLLHAPTSQRTPLGVVIYANSITLTPGTISVEVEEGAILVHAITRAGADGLLAGEMDRRVTVFEGASLMLTLTTALVLLTFVMVVVRVLRGPTVFDRVLAGNSAGTCAMLVLAVYGFLTGRPEFLDIAITYGLLNVISTIAILKYFRFGDLGASSDVEGARK